MVFSFYYTDKIASFVLEKNKLYQEIDAVKDNYEVKSTAAIINGDYIIPGISGKAVDVKESYYNMKSLKTFNEYYLVYEDILPDVSLEKYKDKIIAKGNSSKQSISFILEDDTKIKNFFIQNNYQGNLLVTMDNYENNAGLELINNDPQNYEYLDSLLTNNNLNRHLCVISSSLESICREKQKYLIEPIVLDNASFLKVKKELTSGNIYLIKKGMNLENLKLLIKDIQFKDLKIVYLSELITEN